MPLKAEKAAEWKHLDDSNNICPGCKKTIYASDQSVECSKTKRATYVFWHTECTGKVWH